jgi:hypothetical protein
MIYRIRYRGEDPISNTAIDPISPKSALTSPDDFKD